MILIQNKFKRYAFVFAHEDNNSSRNTKIFYICAKITMSMRPRPLKSNTDSTGTDFRQHRPNQQSSAFSIELRVFSKLF